MAINIKPDISLSAKPPTTMTLPEIVGLARSAQAYQRESEIYPELVKQAQIQTRTASTGEESAAFTFNQKQSDALMGIVGGYRNDPRILSGDPNKAIEAMLEIKSKARNLGIPPAVVEKLASTATQIAVNEPKNLPQYFDNVIQTQIGPSGQQALQTPQLVTSGGQTGIFRGGPATVTTLPLPGAAPVAPAAPSAAAPTGVKPEDMTAPIQPKPAPAPAAAPTAAPAQTSGMVQPDTGRLPVTYPVRQAGVPFAALPQEETDRVAGSQYRNGLVQRQSELTTARRNLQEVVKTAQKIQESVLPSSGIAGAAVRNISTALGDPTYKQLSKDLANVQIANIKAVGGSLDTVGGQQLVRMASGDETFPPDVLLSIARRADADITNLDMMATGMQRHTEKFGDANAKRFQQMWSANADSRIFEIMNIARDVKEPTKRKELTDKLLGDMNEDQRKDLYRKYNNLIKLTNTGDL